MQQIEEYQISEKCHAELHRKGIEHINVDLGKYAGPAVRITLEFDEKLAAELYPLSKDHRFNFNNSMRVPEKDENGNYVFTYADFSERIYNGKVEPRTRLIDLHGTVKKELQTNYSNVINIDHILMDIKKEIENTQTAYDQAAVLEEQRKKLYAEQVARDAEQSKLKEEQQRAQRREEEKKEAEELASQLAWINEHGSKRLKKSFEKNYKCKKLYLLERLKHDVGDKYVLDYDAKIERKNRSCPSMEALLEVERIEKIEGITEAKVVWLPYGTAIEDYNDASEGIEAKFFGYWIYTTEY